VQTKEGKQSRRLCAAEALTLLSEGILPATLQADLQRMGQEEYDRHCQHWAAIYGIKDWRMLIYWRPFSLDNDPCHVRALWQLSTLRLPEAEFDQLVQAWLEGQVPLPEVDYQLLPRMSQVAAAWPLETQQHFAVSMRDSRWRAALTERLGAAYLSVARRAVMLAEPRAALLFPQQVMPLTQNTPDIHCVAEWTQRDIKRPVAAAVHAVQHRSSALRTHAEVQRIVLDTEAGLNTAAHLQAIRVRLQTQKAILRVQAGEIGDTVHVRLLDRQGRVDFDEDVPCTAGQWSKNKRFRG
jgi:hypothetical protein